MQQYSIITKTYTIIFTKLDTDEYEFSTTYNYLEYYGKSYLKNLLFVTDIQCYLNDMNSKIKIEHLDSDKFIMIQFPVPYSNKFELVQLKMLEIDEYKKINVIISKNSDDIKKQISDLKNKADESINKILKTQLVTNNKLNSKINKLEGDYKKIFDELSKLKCKIANNKSKIIGSTDGDNITNRFFQMSNSSDEIKIVNHLKKNIDKYFSNLTDDVVYELKKYNSAMILLASCHQARSISGFIELLATLHFKLTNNSYIYRIDMAGEFCFEYIEDNNIKSVHISEYGLGKNADNLVNINLKDNIDIVIFPFHRMYSSAQLTRMCNITYYY